MSLNRCPFCGGRAERGSAEDGGQFIECTRCHASTAKHYDRCENLESSWNERRNDVPEGCTLEAVHTGDGWSLQVSYPEGHELKGEAIALLEWPESWPEWVDGEFMRRAGFEVV